MGQCVSVSYFCTFEASDLSLLLLTCSHLQILTNVRLAQHHVIQILTVLTMLVVMTVYAELVILVMEDPHAWVCLTF